MYSDNEDTDQRGRGYSLPFKRYVKGETANFIESSPDKKIEGIKLNESKKNKRVRRTRKR